MKKYNSTQFMLRVSILVLIFIVSGNANAAPSLGNYSLANGVYREVLASGSAGQVANAFHFHDGILLQDFDYYGTKYYGVSEPFFISDSTTLVESGFNYDVFKTSLNEGGLSIDGEIWGESDNSFYHLINATAEIRTTIFSNGNVATELLVLGDIDGYSNYNALFSASLTETGSAQYLGNPSLVGTIQNASLEIIPEPASLGLLFLASCGIYFTRHFFVI